jgi:protein Shroom
LKEAKQLKKDVDRRGKIISEILEKILTLEEFDDFNYFISMKAKLIMDSREIEEKITLANEQIVALRSTIMSSDC